MLHSLADVRHVKLGEVPAGEDIRIAFGDIPGKSLKHLSLVPIGTNRMLLFFEAAVCKTSGSLPVCNCHRHIPPGKEECPVIEIKGIESGDADDSVPFGIRKSPFVLAFDIDNAGPGRGFYFGWPEVFIVHVYRGCRNTPGEPGIDHEAGGKRDVGLVMPEPFTFLAHIPRVQCKQSAEGLATD